MWWFLMTNFQTYEKLLSEKLIISRNFDYTFFKDILLIYDLNFFCQIVLVWMPQDFI